MVTSLFLQFANLQSEPLLLVSADGSLLAANRPAAKRLGCSPRVVAGTRLTDFIAESAEEVVRYLSACARTSNPLPGALTLRGTDGKLIACRCEGAVVVPRSDTTPATLQLRLLPKEEASKQFLLLNQRIDALTKEIAARKKAEEDLAASNLRLQRAINETHHRVKNNLQAVSALLEIQKIDAVEGMLPVEALDEALLQIKAIALVHDLLSHEQPIGSVDVRTVLERLMPLLAHTLGWLEQSVKIHLTAESAVLPTKAATALALAVNELISNAVKHGHSLERNNGQNEVFVRLYRQGEGMRLEVEDRGPGFPADFNPAVAAHIGLELVQSLVENDLHGTLTFCNVPGVVPDHSATTCIQSKPLGGLVTLCFPEHPLCE